MSSSTMNHIPTNMIVQGQSQTHRRSKRDIMNSQSFLCNNLGTSTCSLHKHPFPNLHGKWHHDLLFHSGLVPEKAYRRGDLYLVTNFKRKAGFFFFFFFFFLHQSLHRTNHPSIVDNTPRESTLGVASLSPNSPEHTPPCTLKATSSSR